MHKIVFGVTVALLTFLSYGRVSAQAELPAHVEASSLPNASQMEPHIYFPILIASIGNDAANQAVNKPDCVLSAVESVIEDLLTTAAAQQRASMTCDSTLTQVARARARDMAERGYFGHVNPDGIGPNFLVIQAGYPLPESYNLARSGNNIESIAAGFGTAESVWEGWMGSSKHKTHLMGEHAFFQQQHDYGIGYYHDANSDYRHYWVVLTARPGP